MMTHIHIHNALIICTLYTMYWSYFTSRNCSSNLPLQWRHNGRVSVSNYQPHDCFLNCLFRRRSKKTSKLRVTGLCAGNSPGTGEFPAQMASNAEIVSIWWRHHAITASALVTWSSGAATDCYIRIFLYRFQRAGFPLAMSTFIALPWRDAGGA